MSNDPALVSVSAKVLVTGVIHDKCEVKFDVSIPLHEGMTKGWAMREALPEVLRTVEKAEEWAQAQTNREKKEQGE